MILAITERLENRPSQKPFDNRYYLTTYFKEMFDEMNILLFPVISAKNLDKVCDICDGLIVTGSTNHIEPAYYNEPSIPGKAYPVDEYKTDKEIIKAFETQNKPILGICAGVQALNVYFGGSLYQKVPNHNLMDSNHKINIKSGSFLAKTYEQESLMVNSYHFQALKEVAPQFDIIARSDDGIVEGIQKDNILGVQWHPEVANDFHFFKSFIELYVKKK